MKQYILLAFVVVIHTFAFSQPVDFEAAKKVSINLFKGKYHDGYKIKNKHVDVNTNNLSIASSYAKQFNGHNSYYVTNFVGGGWIITSSHQAVGPVIAHSPTGALNEKDMLPPVFVSLMSKYDKLIDFAYQNKIQNDNQSKRWNNAISSANLLTSASLSGTSSGSSNGYLLSTKWGQNYSYDNASCAAYNNDPSLVSNCSGTNNSTGHYLAGCGPVAVGQIMKYWGYAQGDGADFDWWNMPDVLNYMDPNGVMTPNPQFQTQSLAISHLFVKCGDQNHLQATYGCTATGITGINPPVQSTFQKFNYNCLNNGTNGGSGFSSYNDFSKALQTEIVTNQRPVLFTCQLENTSFDGIGGHVYVCDGYIPATSSTDEEFHFNFGWNGASDGFYSLENHYTVWTTFGLVSHTRYNLMQVDNTKVGTIIFEDSQTTIYTGIQPIWSQLGTETIGSSTIGSSPLSTNETWQASSLVAGSSSNTAFVVPSGNNARLVAAQSILFLPGVNVQPGSHLFATLYQNATGGLKEYIETMNEPNVVTQNDSSEIAIIDNKELTIDAYPNPLTNGTLTIYASKAITGKVVIELYDLLGIKVFASTEEGLSSKQIPFGSFAKGIYLLKVSYNNSSVFTSKVLY